MFKAHRLLFHSILGLRVIKKKNKKVWVLEFGVWGFRVQNLVFGGSGFRV